MYKHFRRVLYWVNLWDSTQYINWCYALRAFNQVPILVWRYIHCTELGSSETCCFEMYKISDINIEKILVYVSSTTPTVQTRVQCNENSTRSYENLSVSKLVKTAIDTAITVKLLKSKVTLLNTWEKLKMSHEHNVTFEITQRSMKCGSGCGTERIRGTDMEIKCGTERIWIKCVILMSFFRLFFYVSVF
jgi:hypothetical protein